MIVSPKGGGRRKNDASSHPAPVDGFELCIGLANTTQAEQPSDRAWAMPFARVVDHERSSSVAWFCKQLEIRLSLQQRLKEGFEVFFLEVGQCADPVDLFAVLFGQGQAVVS